MFYLLNTLVFMKYLYDYVFFVYIVYMYCIFYFLYVSPSKIL